MSDAAKPSDYDSPWKEALEVYFEAFIAFFFPEAHAGIDWAKGYEFLDKELQQVVHEAEVGRRTVDKLVGVRLLGGEEAWVLVHVEVQSQRDAELAERMYVYNYRLFDRYHRKVASFAVLADDQRRWRPSAFGYTLWGCEVSLRFPMVKLLDYRSRWEELEASRNPFAVVVMAHLEALRTRQDAASRKAAKLSLVRGLHRRGLGEKDVRQLFRFMDWLMSLPEELQAEFLTEVRALEEDNKMPYVTQTERMAIEKGLKQGLEQGLKVAVRQALEVRFGEAGLTLMSEVETLEDESLLRRINEALLRGSSLEEVRQIWQV